MKDTQAHNELVERVLKGQPDDSLMEKLFAGAQFQVIKKNKILFRQGDKGNNKCYILIAGKLVVIKNKKEPKPKNNIEGEEENDLEESEESNEEESNDPNIQKNMLEEEAIPILQNKGFDAAKSIRIVSKVKKFADKIQEQTSQIPAKVSFNKSTSFYGDLDQSS